MATQILRRVLQVSVAHLLWNVATDTLIIEDERMIERCRWSTG